MAKKNAPAGHLSPQDSLERDAERPDSETDARSGPAVPDAPEEVPSRIRQAGRNIRAEATRTLAREKPPARRAASRRLERFSPPGLADCLSPEDRLRVVEVPDASDRPLLCMPPESVLRQKLPFRLAVTVLRTRQNRLVLRRRKDARLGMQGSWDVYTGFIFAGEALEDAAIRLLEADAGVGGLGISLLSAETGEDGARRALLVAELPLGLHPAHEAGELLEVDADELKGLVRDTPELLAPEVVWARRIQGVFRKK